MGNQLHYQDIEVGIEVPALVKRPTTRQLVKWAGASGDFYELHYDKDFAQSQGLPKVVVHGALVYAFLGQMLTSWAGEQGTIKKLSCSFRGVHLAGEQLTCKGKVSKKYIAVGEHQVECEVWVENTSGEKSVTGTAIVILLG